MRARRSASAAGSPRRSSTRMVACLAFGLRELRGQRVQLARQRARGGGGRPEPAAAAREREQRADDQDFSDSHTRFPQTVSNVPLPSLDQSHARPGYVRALHGSGATRPWSATRRRTARPHGSCRCTPASTCGGSSRRPCTCRPGSTTSRPSIALSTASTSVLSAFFTAFAHSVDVDVGVHHRIVGHGLLVGDAPLLRPLLVRLHPLEVLRRLERHEVVPRGQMADERLDVEGLQLHLGEAERHHRATVGGHALVGQLLEEGHVAVAVDRVDDGGVAARRRSS